MQLKPLPTASESEIHCGCRGTQGRSISESGPTPDRDLSKLEYPFNAGRGYLGVFDYTFSRTCHSQIDRVLFLQSVKKWMLKLFGTIVLVQYMHFTTRIFISLLAVYRISQSDDNDDNYS